MEKSNINYIRKLSDINFKLKTFEEEFGDKDVYLFNIYSRTKDIKTLKRKLWISWAKKFFKRFPAKCFGVVEKTQSGLWHLHVWIVFDRAYSQGYVLSKVSVIGRRIWAENHLRVTNLNLIKKNQFTSSLLISFQKSRNYLCKSKRYLCKKSPYITKPFTMPGSFAVSYGLKGLKLWSKRDLPSYKYSPKTLKKNLCVPVDTSDSNI